MSLYLKYRPQDFDNLVWQKFINDTLKTAIINNKLVGAYLFCWPRWTWKTTTARLLAKTINCLNPKDWNPCLKCEICTSFVEERLVDIIEIDAASHTWVDNIRDIIERANFSPTLTKYKVYIIDEVHMLSKWAFNALLKILEEPPSHVKFILATTETHKVPETIISRCQRYDFRRISNEDIISRLKYISKEENIKVDDDSYIYIANHSNWWLRNAISLYEQMIENKEISIKKIEEKLGLLWEKELELFLNMLITKDTKSIDFFDKLIDDGKNIKLFFRDLIFFTKDKILIEIKSGKGITNYLEILEILDETYSKTKNSLDENTSFMIWVLKILDFWNTSIKAEKNNFNDSESSSEWQSKKLSEKSDKKDSNNSESSSEWQENKIVQKKEEKITKDDILETFFEEDTSSQIKEEKTTKNISSWNFNSWEFVSKLKEAWAKSVITASFIGTSIKIKDKILEINPANKMSKKNISTAESHSMIKQALSLMWYEDLELKII